MDEAISHVISVEFWEQIAKLPDIAGTVIRFFMKRFTTITIDFYVCRWYMEARDKHPNGGGDDSVSVLYRSDSSTQAMPAILKQSPFDAQAECVHCMKLCNISTIIARYQPVWQRAIFSLQC